MNVMCVKPILTVDRECVCGRPEVGDIDRVVKLYQRVSEKYYFLERFGVEEAYKSSHFSELTGSTENELLGTTVIKLT